MAFGDVDATHAVLRCILPFVSLCVGAPTCWRAHRLQPGTWLTCAVIGLHAMILTTALLGLAQLLVPASSKWGGAAVADVFNTAACTSLVVMAHCCWLLAAQV
eukprot:COSAG05_NODE_11356_length_517_cov_1.035885_1_plen_102_part_01